MDVRERSENEICQVGVKRKAGRAERVVHRRHGGRYGD